MQMVNKAGKSKSSSEVVGKEASTEIGKEKIAPYAQIRALMNLLSFVESGKLLPNGPSSVHSNAFREGGILHAADNACLFSSTK
nr:hypothetical protein [Tanacetum cinerariifolium]